MSFCREDICSDRRCRLVKGTKTRQRDVADRYAVPVVIPAILWNDTEEYKITEQINFNSTKNVIYDTEICLHHILFF